MTSYLIVHKVRGEPAFDVAEQMEVNGESWWVIPTSGHRAYPYAHFPLDLANQIDPGLLDLKNWIISDDHPDHYPTPTVPREAGVRKPQIIVRPEDL